MRIAYITKNPNGRPSEKNPDIKEEGEEKGGLGSSRANADATWVGGRKIKRKNGNVAGSSQQQGLLDRGEVLKSLRARCFQEVICDPESGEKAREK